MHCTPVCDRCGLPAHYWCLQVNSAGKALHEQAANTAAHHQPPHPQWPLLPQENRIRSSQSEFLSWKKCRNKHNLLELSQQVQCCLLLGNQAGKWLILNTGSCSLAANWSIQERGSCLWPRTSLCFSPLGTRQGRSLPRPQQTESSVSPGGSQALGQKHCPGKASPEQADPAAVLLLLLRTAMVGTRISAGPGCSAAQQLPPIVCHCCHPAWGF